MRGCRFSETIDGVNVRLRAFAERHQHVEYLDCGAGFLQSDRSALRQALMPDALHPSSTGRHCPYLLPADWILINACFLAARALDWRHLLPWRLTACLIGKRSAKISRVPLCRSVFPYAGLEVLAECLKPAIKAAVGH